MALLAAGVFASSLELVYVSIGISILAAIVLSAGVLLRRGEIFGAAGAARQGAASDWPTADGAGVPALAGGQAKAERGDWPDHGQADSRSAAPAVAESGLGRERGSAEPASREEAGLVKG